MIFYRGTLIFSFVFFTSVCASQQHKIEKWTNKDKGTYTVSFSYMPVVPTDSPDNVGVSVKMYELTHEGCKRIEGYVKINEKSYFVYDSTWVVDEDGEKEIGNYFRKFSTTGIHEFTASAGKLYYPIKTGKLQLVKGTSYEFIFYFVRKDALKRD